MSYPPPGCTREAIAAAVRDGAATTGEIAAACGVPDDDSLRWEIAGMAAEGWFVQVQTGPGRWRLDLTPGR